MAGTGLAGGAGHRRVAWPGTVKLPGRDIERRPGLVSGNYVCSAPLQLV